MSGERKKFFVVNDALKLIWWWTFKSFYGWGSEPDFPLIKCSIQRVLSMSHIRHDSMNVCLTEPQIILKFRMVKKTYLRSSYVIFLENFLVQIIFAFNMKHSYSYAIIFLLYLDNILYPHSNEIYICSAKPFISEGSEIVRLEFGIETHPSASNV